MAPQKGLALHTKILLGLVVGALLGVGARWLAGAGMATGGVFLVVAAGIFAIMCLFFTFAAIASRAGPGGFSTPTPFLFPTP